MDNNTQVKERVLLWDNLKFIMILFVVLGHIVQYYQGTDSCRSMLLFVLLVHMPAFMFVTGLFSKNSIKNRRYDRVIGFFAIYIVTKIVIYVSQRICRQEVGFSLLTESGVPWFAFSIGVFFLVTMAVSNCKKVYVLVISILLACFVGYDSAVNDYLVLARTITFFPYFYLGYCLNQDDVLRFTKKMPVKIISAVIVIATAIICILFLDETWWMSTILFAPFNNIAHAEWAWALRFFRYIVGLVLILAFISLTPNKKLPLITDMGGRTIQVFVLHRPFIYLWFGFNMDQYVQMFMPNHWKYFSVFVFGGLLTLVLSTKRLSGIFHWLQNPRK